jgi:hypothetical protein
MPCVWWPWACQLLAVDRATTFIELDLVTSEPHPIRGAVVEAGTPFSIRVSGGSESSTSDLPVVAEWLEAGAAVTILAGRHERSSWVCLSVGHRRIVLNDVVSNLGLEAPVEPEAWWLEDLGGSGRILRSAGSGGSASDGTPRADAEGVLGGDAEPVAGAVGQPADHAAAGRGDPVAERGPRLAPGRTLDHVISDRLAIAGRRVPRQHDLARRGQCP